jgi:hypothetical protein
MTRKSKPFARSYQFAGVASNHLELYERFLLGWASPQADGHSYQTSLFASGKTRLGGSGSTELAEVLALPGNVREAVDACPKRPHNRTSNRS